TGVRIRAPWWHWLLAGALVVAFGAGFSRLVLHDRWWVDTASLVSTQAVVMFVLWGINVVDLTPIELRRRPGRSPLPWAAIEAVELHRGRFITHVVLRLSSGKSITLRETDGMPFATRHAELTHHQIRQWWLAHRDRPGPPPPPPPAPFTF